MIDKIAFPSLMAAVGRWRTASAQRGLKAGWERVDSIGLGWYSAALLKATVGASSDSTRWYSIAIGFWVSAVCSTLDSKWMMGDKPVVGVRLQLRLERDNHLTWWFIYNNSASGSSNSNNSSDRQRTTTTTTTTTTTPYKTKKKKKRKG